MTIGELIKLKRKQARLSQKALADELGITQSYVCQLENNAKAPSNDLIADMAWYFKMPFGCFLLASISEDNVAPESIDLFRKKMPEIQRVLSQIKFTV